MPIPVPVLRSLRSARLAAALAGALAALAAAPPAGAQFVLWETLSAANPFSVTAAVRGVSPSPSLKLEAIVGFNNGSNQFLYHATPALTATSPSIGLRRIDMTQAVDFTDFGVQSAFNGRCCSNNSIGLTDDTTVHTSSNFAAGTSAEVLIGTPELRDPWGSFGDYVPALVEERTPNGPFAIISWFLSGEGFPPFFVAEPEGTISFRRIAVGSHFPMTGLTVHSIDGAVGTAPVAQPSLTDCLGVSSNWHFTMDRSDPLDENFVACVKTNGNLVLKRVEIDPDAVAEIPLATGVGTSSAIFAYLHVAVCPISTGTVVGTVIPRQSLGTSTFFATYLSGAGTVVGTSQVTLPGARANHQAFGCRSRGDLATFFYHGTGQTPTTTADTFAIEVGEASLTPAPGGGTPLLVRRVTESRRVDWADAFPTEIYSPAGQTTELDYRGLEPVAEIQAGTSSNVRYGGIRVPLFFHNFESGDLRFFSVVAP